MTKHERRDAGGRFSTGHLCDFCNKPTGADFETDPDVCGGGDGPGFFLCSRKRCSAKREVFDVEARRRMYAHARSIR